ncbi:hypothetical protein MK805_12520 [Shimazuella sp. AN120528]|uniref:hypothetical protein n=1 Tax=Shimazuella soli TaxID=1892854 RepID=UPI001F0FD475|nr:hypothetical protein [Shimazuella soli]MCH5585767.1 hypothetical protein [Shimazuella soli]
MNKKIKRKGIFAAYLTAMFLSFVIVFLPHTVAFAAYKTVAMQTYKTSYTSAPFKYIKGGLGIRAYCTNTKGKYQTMYLQRKISGGWVTRGTRTVYCNKGSDGTLMKYNYFYIPNTVSGQYYRLKFVNSDSRTSTNIFSEVNPN